MNSPGRKSLLIGPGRLNLVHVEPDGLMYNSAVVISDGETKRALIRFVSWRMVAVIGVTKSRLGSLRPGKTRRMVSATLVGSPSPLNEGTTGRAYSNRLGVRSPNAGGSDSSSLPAPFETPVGFTGV